MTAPYHARSLRATSNAASRATPTTARGPRCPGYIEGRQAHASGLSHRAVHMRVQGYRMCCMVRVGAACCAVIVVGAEARSGWVAEPRAEGAGAAQTQPSSLAASSAAPQRALLDRYCVPCHNERLQTGGLALDTMDVSNVREAREVWERVVQKLRGGMMRPQTGRGQTVRPTRGSDRGWKPHSTALPRLPRNRVVSPPIA